MACNATTRSCSVSDADQDAGGERDGQRACRFEGGQPPDRGLVRRAAMGGQVRSQALEHHSLGGGHGAQRGQRALADRASVGMRQQAGLGEHQVAHGLQVVDGRGVPVGVQPRLGLRVASFGVLPQREQRLVTAGASTLLSDRQHLLRGEVRGLHRSRRGGERAVPAPVPAESGQRDEDLGREGDPRAVHRISHRARSGGELAGAQRRQVDLRHLETLSDG
jgi:hypothetical protein